MNRTFIHGAPRAAVCVSSARAEQVVAHGPAALPAHLLPFLVSLMLAVTCCTGAAQSTVTTNGPYYATPSWDQTLTTGRFVLLTNMRSEAVLDRETGLVWERAPDSSLLPQDGAHSRCAGRLVGGRLGWRLPSIDELSSLVDPAVPAPGPKLPPGHPFVLPAGPEFWSSTLIQRDIDPGPTAYSVRFDGGFVRLNLTTALLQAWCVRGGNR